MRRWAEILVWVLVVGAPLALGGVHPPVFVAVAALGGAALALAAAARLRRGMPVPAAAAALAGGTLLALLSCVRLPAGLAGWLSPRARLLATLPPEPPGNLALSLDPPASLADAARLAGLAALLVAAAALARRPGAARRLAMAVAVAAAAVLAAGAVHAVAGLDRIWGFYPALAEGLLPGPFVSPDHASALLVLGALAALGLAAAAHGPARVAWLLASGACALGMLATLSLAGVAGLLAGGAFFGLLLARRQANGRARFAVAVAVGGAAVVAAALLAEEWLGDGPPSGLPGRFSAWPGTLRLVADHWLPGIGRGAFSAVFPAYEPPGTLRLVTHPESFPLQWAAEWGVPAALLGLAALGWTLTRAARTTADADAEPLRRVLDGLLAGVGAVLVHDLSGFSLEFAGVGVPFVVALGVVAGRAAGPVRLDARAAVAAGVAALGVGGAALAWGMPALADRQLQELLEAAPTLEARTLDEAYRRVRRSHPADPLVALRAGDALLARSGRADLPPTERHEALVRSLPHLARAQELARSHASHLLTARALLRLGRRQQALTELRRAMALGADPGSVLDEALRAGADAAELASLAVALEGAPEGRAEPDPIRAAAELVRRLARERDRPAAALAAAHLLLGDDDALLPGRRDPGRYAADAGLAAAACEAALLDAACAGARPGCSPAPQAAASVAAAGTLGRRLVQEAPDDERGWLCAVEAERRAGRDAPAAELLARARARLPESLPLRLHDARARLAAGRAAEAVQLLENTRLPEDRALAVEVTQLRLGALLAAGRTARAAAEADSLVRDHAGEAWAWRLAARVREADAQPARALESLRVAETLAGPAELEDVRAERRRLEAARPGAADAGP